MTEQQLLGCKKLLRSVLIPEKDGIPVGRISGEKFLMLNKLECRIFTVRCYGSTVSVMR